MKRKFFIIRTSADYHSDYKRAIGIDYDNRKEILAFLKENDKKFKLVAEKMLSHNFMYSDHYGKEDINQDCKNVAAMKLFKGKDNPRLYCQEKNTPDGTLIVICSDFLEKKKSQKNDKSINEIIKKVSKYEYEIIKEEQ